MYLGGDINVKYKGPKIEQIYFSNRFIEIRVAKNVPRQLWYTNK